jgi:hypothetical protein
MTRFDLEQHIMQAWLTCEDLDLLLWRSADCAELMSEDELHNLLLAIRSLHESRMLKLWNCYEESLRK